MTASFSRQVLQFIDVVPAALREIHRILSPKGVALISVPCVSRVDPEAGFDRDYWRFSRVGLQRLLETAPWSIARPSSMRKPCRRARVSDGTCCRRSR